MGLSYEENQAKEHALKYEIAQQRGFMSMGVPSGSIAIDLVDASESLGREVGVDLEWILGIFTRHPEAEARRDIVNEVVFAARSLAKVRAERSKPLISLT
jgi:hypothetical protein